MENVFEIATRKKARFVTGRGSVNVEDLWDLSLDQLDEVAKAINKQVKDSSEESFVKKTTSADKFLVLRLEVVKSIIATKLTEEEKRKTAAERKAKRERLMGLIAEKQDNAMARKSIASLEAELNKLDEDGEED